MKSKLYLLSALILILAVGVVSATLTLEQISISEPVEHNSDVVVTFTLTSDTNYPNLVWSGTGSNLIWKTLPITTSIAFGEELTLTAVLTINEHASGTITDAQIIVTDADTDTLEISGITIAESPLLSITSDVEIPEGETSTTITVENIGNVDLTQIELTQSGDFIVEFDVSSNIIFLLEAGESEDVIVTITTPLNELDVGENSVTITATAQDETSALGVVSTTVPFCDCTNPGNLKLDIDDVYVSEGFGDDDDYWYPFDEIEIDLFIESDDYDIEDIEIEWELYTESGDKIADDTETDFDLDEGEDKEIMITFKLDDKLSKLEGEDSLIFYAKATGRIDDNDAPVELDNEDTCDWASQEVELITDDDFVVLDDIQFPELIQCGAEVQITADVWNIGDDDQDDVYVIIYNHELGINQQVEIGDLDAFDDMILDTIIKIPTNAEEKSYSLILWIYDEDNDMYENSEDEIAEFIVPFKIEGNCIVGPTVLVTANLESGGKSGEELVVKATITNLGNKLSTYDLNVIEYDGWASSVELDKSTVVLGEGESQNVLLTFDVKEDVVGDKLFDLELLSRGEVVLTQPVSVSITSSGFNFPGITGNVISEDNWYLWGIGALNIILVLIIIFVAVKAIKK